MNVNTKQHLAFQESLAALQQKYLKQVLEILERYPRSVYQLSKETGISWQYLSRFLRNETTCKGNALLKIAFWLSKQEEA